MQPMDDQPTLTITAINGVGITVPIGEYINALEHALMCHFPELDDSARKDRMIQWRHDWVMDKVRERLEAESAR